MTDHLERLRGLARLDWPAEVALLVGTLSEAELDRLADLLREGRPVERWRVRACLDRVVEDGGWRG
jgi:hypothetical protein